MKIVLWGLGIIVVGTALFGMGWISHGRTDKISAATPSSTGSAPIASVAPGNPTANTPPVVPHPAFVSQNEFQHLRSARDAVMQANPALAAEYKEIINEMQAQQTKLDAAMIKADPKVAPIVAKLVELRQHNGAPASTAGPSPR